MLSTFSGSRRLRMLAELTFLVTVTVARTTHAQSGNVGATDRVQRIAGCYHIALGAWSGQNYGVPPEHFELDTAVRPMPLRHGYVLRPTAFATRILAPPFWNPLGADSVKFGWSTGFSGVELRARFDGDSLTGRARAFHDAHRAGEPPDAEAPFVAKREKCGAVTRADMNREARRVVIDSIAHALRRNYVWPDTAARMAEYLSHRLASGAYDHVADPEQLATTLTRDLRSVYRDVHLSISYAPPREAFERRSHAPATHTTTTSALAYARRDKFGIGKVELLAGNVGYVSFVHLFEVGPESRSAVASAFSTVRRSSALIIDLRGNRGGSPDMVRLICSYLFPVRTHLNDLYERRSGTTTQYWTEPDRRITTLFPVPVFVLVSHETFSAAEELAYDLQSRHRAVVVGETTGGGAHAVWGIPVGHGFVANIPYARAINPVTRTNWEGIGVQPDVAVSADSALDAAVAVAHTGGGRGGR